VRLVGEARISQNTFENNSVNRLNDQFEELKIEHKKNENVNGKKDCWHFASHLTAAAFTTCAQG
jgi:hypothetical protein